MEQTKPTEATLKHSKQLQDYLHSNPNAKIKYIPSDMYLKIHSDCSYLSLPNARSRVGGHFYFGNEIKLDEEDINYGPIYTECSVLKPVVSLAAEGELASTFVNAQKGVILRNTANELG